MKDRRILQTNEYTNNGWYEICQPSWRVFYHKYGEEGRRKCNPIERLLIVFDLIWNSQGMKFSSRFMLSARILILFIAQSLNLPQRIESKLWSKDFVRLS